MHNMQITLNFYNILIFYVNFVLRKWFCLDDFLLFFLNSFGTAIFTWLLPSLPTSPYSWSLSRSRNATRFSTSEWETCGYIVVLVFKCSNVVFCSFYLKGQHLKLVSKNLNRYGDMRKIIGFKLREMWNNLGKSSFLYFLSVRDSDHNYKSGRM